MAIAGIRDQDSAPGSMGTVVGSRRFKPGWEKRERNAMVSVRMPEPRSWEPPADIDLNDGAAVAYWAEKLQVTPSELEEVVERVNLSAHADDDKRLEL